MRNSADQKTLYSNFNAFAVEVFKVFNNVIGMGFTSEATQAIQFLYLL